MKKLIFENIDKQKLETLSQFALNSRNKTDNEIKAFIQQFGFQFIGMGAYKIVVNVPGYNDRVWKKFRRTFIIIYIS
jgi:hypothetical protein